MIYKISRPEMSSEKGVLKNFAIFIYSGLFWSAFSRIQSEYEKMRTRITPNMDFFYTVYI